VKRWYAIAVFWVILVVGALVWENLRERGAVGAGYVAKEVCSCVFVGGRSLESCRADVPSSMDRVQAELGEDRVRAFVPALAERIARYEPPYGCVLY
jgi:hypothetical protein